MVGSKRTRLRCLKGVASDQGSSLVEETGTNAWKRATVLVHHGMLGKATQLVESDTTRQGATQGPTKCIRYVGVSVE